jgi:hypothetical protein
VTHPGLPARAWTRLRYTIVPVEEVRTDKRRFLFEYISHASVGAEIGVWKGDFSAQILWAVRPRKLHLIDPWEFIADMPRAKYGGGVAATQDDMDRIYTAVRSRLRKYPIVWHRMTSTEAASRIKDGSLDWAYIDGNHSYEYVAQDLQDYWKKIRSGGLLVGDDYNDSHWWGDGVVRAVNEFVGRTKCQPLEIGTKQQYVIQKP